jgi:hypothetical protein
MTIRRDQDTIHLDDVCAVEDAEILLQELGVGMARIDWSGCTHLHTACLQVLMAAGVPMSGVPANPSLARWVAPLLRSCVAPDIQTAHPVET